MKRTSPATIIASLALFVSLGGTSFAAQHYLINSVGQIKPSVRHALQGSRGPQGPPGAVGASGAVISHTIFEMQGFLADSKTETATVTLDASSQAVTAACPVGWVTLNGGYSGSGELVTGSFGNGTNTGWTVVAHLDPAASTGYATAWATCVYDPIDYPQPGSPSTK